jgi:hypothetical protein
MATNEYSITCVDNFDDFYNPEIKRKNIESYIGNADFKLVEAYITDNLQACKNPNQSITFCANIL